MTTTGSHDIGWLKVTKDDRWLVSMQIIQYGAKLDTNIENFLDWKFSSLYFQVVLKGLAFDKSHHEIEAPTLLKMLMDIGKVRMLKSRKQVSLPLKCLFRFFDFLGLQVLLA